MIVKFSEASQCMTTAQYPAVASAVAVGTSVQTCHLFIHLADLPKAKSEFPAPYSEGLRI